MSGVYCHVARLGKFVRLAEVHRLLEIESQIDLKMDYMPVDTSDSKAGRTRG